MMFIHIDNKNHTNLEDMLRKLWKSSCVIRDILSNARGYIINSTNVPLEFDEFSKELHEEGDLDITKKSMEMVFSDNLGKPVVVYWTIGEKCGPYIKDIIKSLAEDEIYHAILIVDGKLTSDGKNELITPIKGEKMFDLEIFSVAELQYNALDHSYVPKHTILNQSEKRHILSSYGVNGTQLPKIMSSDPIIRLLGASKGELIEIRGKSSTYIKETIHYRIVT